ncbi:tail protein X [Leisingera sp. MMG026]|uniref:tail protein X n=1 Tax=Leisingera sp. MMG026 TaxID=2909982 RepID=UPI001F21D79B|nr:tail protein X [Leisingera sp. MMG026]MCF6432507.1 tail protein X [Leisingera sp. MMG026]
MRYRTERGDVLDAICAAHYGANAFDLQKVLAANMGLAALGPVFPRGIAIELPEDARIDPKPKMIRLVD